MAGETDALVHVVVAEVDRPPGAWTCLEPFELARIERLQRVDDRAAFAMAHGLARLLAARFARVSLNDIRIGYWATGQPRFESPLAELALSLSHARRMVAVVVGSDAEVGIDVETLDGAAPEAAVLAQVLSRAERAEITSLDVGSARTARFMRFWTAKEAIVKATGEGIATRELADIDISGTAAPLSDLSTRAGLAGRWHLEINATADSVWSLAVRHRSAACRVIRHNIAALLAEPAS
jgi:4'-phosphopantetheinyl transferase